jgi:uncharacterized protein YndB with AHSA1/START domain
VIALWVLGAVVLLAVAAAIVLTLAGLFVPRAHVAASEVRLRAAPEAVWDALADREAWPEWAPGVRTMERLPDRDGRAVWRASSGHRPMTSVDERCEPPRILVTRIADDDLPFGGSWTWELSPDGAGTRVRLTEDGFIRVPAFRAVARFLSGYRGTQRRFLAALASRVGEPDAEVRPVRPE